MSLYVSPSEVDALARDGAAVVRGVLDAARLERMRAAIEDAMNDRDAVRIEMTKGEGRFYNGFFQWLRNAEFRDLIMDSALPEVAATFLGAREVNFFYDQLLVKEANTDEVTPWHTDGSYYPITGGRLVSIWVPFDPATPKSGVVTYVKGSHRWPKEVAAERMTTMSPPSEDFADFETISWTVDPGDVIVHDLNAVHGAPGNLSSHRRRALATRWVDQDVRYKPIDNDFIETLRKNGHELPAIDVEPGQRLSSPLFPRVWPREA